MLIRQLVHRTWGSKVGLIAKAHILYATDAADVRIRIDSYDRKSAKKIVTFANAPLFKITGPFSLFFASEFPRLFYVDGWRSVRKGHFHRTLNTFIKTCGKPVFCLTENKNIAARKAALRFNPTEVDLG